MADDQADCILGVMSRDIWRQIGRRESVDKVTGSFTFTTPNRALHDQNTSDCNSEFGLCVLIVVIEFLMRRYCYEYNIGERYIMHSHYYFVIMYSCVHSAGLLGFSRCESADFETI